MERILTISTLFKYIKEYFPDLFFWDGFTKHEPRNPSKSYLHRAGMPNEIRFEYDSKDKNKNWEDINQTAINLWEAGFSFAIFSVEGGRSPHLHMYDCDELETLSLKQRQIYRERFLKKYCPKGSNPDLGLCDEKHLCALEFVNHFKYKKPKRLLSFFDRGTLSNQGCDSKIWASIVFGKEKEKKVKKLLKRKLKFGDMLKAKKSDLIMNLLTFEEVLDKYKIKHKGKMACCPFHNDTNFSLSFSNEKSVWKCWGTGCEKKGDLITLIKLLEDLKND